MVLDVEPGMSVSHCACGSFVMCLLQMRTLQEYQMFPSSKRLLNCSTDSFISVSSSLALGYRQWYAPLSAHLLQSHVQGRSKNTKMEHSVSVHEFTVRDAISSLVVVPIYQE